MKTCTKCGETKPLSEYGRDARKKSGLRARCKTCAEAKDKVYREQLPVRDARIQRQRQYYREHKEEHYIRQAKANRSVQAEKAREYLLKRKYGVSLSDYNDMLAAQNGVCAICKGNVNVAGKVLHVDHEKETGRVRGLLCSNCNTGIGLLRHDLSIILGAYKYLAPMGGLEHLFEIKQMVLSL